LPIGCQISEQSGTESDLQMTAAAQAAVGDGGMFDELA